MAYTPTTWKDRVVEKPRTYTIQENGDGTITLIPAPGTIYEPGTPVNAPNMNKIENGLQAAAAIADSAASAISTHAGRTDNPHNVTKSQVGLGSVQNYGIASQAQAEAGSANNVYMTPLRTKNYVDVRLQNNLQLRMNNGVVEYNDGMGWKPMAAVKSVQRGETGVGTGSQTVDVTISAVNLSKSFLNLNNVINTRSAEFGAMLTSSTNIRIWKRGSAAMPGGDGEGVLWEVVEFY